MKACVAMFAAFLALGPAPVSRRDPRPRRRRERWRQERQRPARPWRRHLTLVRAIFRRALHLVFDQLPLCGDEITSEPVPARAYEHESLSGFESVGIVRFLMRLDPPSPEIVAAVRAAGSSGIIQNGLRGG
jgi:hypothetical protein